MQTWLAKVGVKDLESPDLKPTEHLCDEQEGQLYSISVSCSWMNTNLVHSLPERVEDLTTVQGDYIWNEKFQIPKVPEQTHMGMMISWIRHWSWEM